VSGGMEEDLWLFRHHTEASSEHRQPGATRLDCFVLYDGLRQVLTPFQDKRH
jgi:hypothetical protein